MEAGEYGLTRGTCFIARCLELVAVPDCCGFRGVLRVGRVFSCFFFSSNAHGLLKGMRPPLASFTSLLVDTLRKPRALVLMGNLSEAVS